jgi:hypothetical protein
MRFIILSTLLLALAGCTAQQRNYAPVVDLASSDKTEAQYNNDLAQCQALASQRNPAAGTAVSTGVGAAAGAAAGTLLGVMGGKPAHGLWQGAALGGMGGLGYGAFSGYNDQQDMVKNCLRGRGYIVVGT